MTTLPDAEWRTRSGLVRVIALLSADGTAARVVGGAVRDTLLGLPVADIDLATPLLPQEVMARLQQGGVKVVPTGLAHGTVTAVCDGQVYEITTLRRDVATDGRRATVAFAQDWREDAARRDFTINALYADLVSGEMFDWFGGQADLDACIVRFIGDPATRIAEDHLRILRFYRFAARFGKGALDAASHAAVIAARTSLRTLSRERVADELFKLLGLPDPLAMVGQMAADGVLAEIVPEVDPAGLARLAQLLTNEAVIAAVPDAVRRFAALLPGPDAADAVGPRLRLSGRQRSRLVVLTTQRGSGLTIPPRALAYRHGVQAALDSWMLGGGPETVIAAHADVAGWAVPTLPIKGGALVARGIAAGPDVARLLKRIEEQWIDAAFPEGAALTALVDQLLASEARQ